MLPINQTNQHFPSGKKSNRIKLLGCIRFQANYSCVLVVKAVRFK